MNNYLNGRTPIPKGGKININGIIYENLDSPSEVCTGSSCLVYHVASYNSSHYPKTQLERLMLEGLEGMIPEYYILKEFYPLLENGSIYRDVKTNELIIDKDTKQDLEYQQRLKQFKQGVSRAQELSKIKHQSITVPYVMDSTIGDSHYIVTEYNGKSTLKNNTNRDREDLSYKLSHSFLILDPFVELEKLGYLMLDIKPENILDDMNESDESYIQIVDTDSIYRPGDNINDILLLSNARYAAPEVTNLQLFSSSDVIEIASDILTPYASMYSLGKYLFEYFWEEPFRKKNLSDYDNRYLLSKLSELYDQNKILDFQSVGLKLIEVLSRVLIEDLTTRMCSCYDNIEEFQSALCEMETLYFHIKNPDYVPLSDEEADALFEELHNELIQWCEKEFDTEAPSFLLHHK